MKFELLNRSGKSRRGKLYTDHGIVHTPNFMFVATAGTVKTQTMREIKDTGAQIIVNNTYHLYLRPGTEVINEAGGLHKFIGWDGAILTDSGGFQVFSLSDLRKIDEEGVTFRSHIDGSYHKFTPENVIRTQRMLGSDVMMVLDECVSYPADYNYARNSVERTLRWAQRCFNEFDKTNPLYGYNQALAPITQGSIYMNLREYSAVKTVEMFPNLPLYAIGGLAVGEPKFAMKEIVSLTTDIFPENSVRYLMGVGSPEDIIESVRRGVDLFDCVIPTRNARNGMLFTFNGPIKIRNAKYEKDFTPPDPTCNCYLCQNHTKAYLRHLIMNGEMSGKILATIHNIHFFQELMRRIRKAIEENRFEEFAEETLSNMKKEEV